MIPHMGKGRSRGKLRDVEEVRVTERHHIEPRTKVGESSSWLYARRKDAREVLFCDLLVQ